jgi:diacylglycerol kinase
MANELERGCEARRHNRLDSSPAGTAPVSRERDSDDLPTGEVPRRIDAGPRRRRQRPKWRERLVVAERGIVGGMRRDAAFAVHLFSVSIVTMAGAVLGLNWASWLVVVGALTLVLTVELIHQSIRALAAALPDEDSRGEASVAAAIAQGAVVVAFIGSLIAISIVFGRRIDDLF